MIACMGGFCSQRDRCANYLTDSRNRISERLCRINEEPEIVLASDRQAFDLAPDSSIKDWQEATS